MRTFDISSAKQGVTRLRNKGGPAKDSFYTLKNCYVTADKSVVPRPGTRLDTVLPSGTKGLMMFRGLLYVFSSEPLVIANPKYVCMVLQHPDPANSSALAKIHFAQPFLGYPYVVASFESDPENYYHYWLQNTGSWTANTFYTSGEVVQPTVQNGYTYSATRIGGPNPTWSAGTAVTVGMKLEPTVANGYYYEVIDTAGSNPVTGATEPAWIATDGAIVYEDVDGSAIAPPTPPPAPTVPPSVGDRYGNQGGSGGNLTNESRSEQ